jgi:hypothetical protein
MDNIGGTMDNIQSAVDIKGGGIFNQAELFFDDLFLKKLPPLPAQIRDLLVKLAPFWAICMIAFAVLQIVFGSLAVLLGLLGTFLSIATLSGSSVIRSVLGIVQSIVGLALGALILIYLAKSLRSLFNYKDLGWQALFRAKMVSLIYAVFSWLMTILISVVSLSGLGAIMGIGSSIIMLPIWLILFGLSFYLLFQIKDRYARVNA